jgi:branched-chain amino acid transport system substrate-binding protein
MRWTFIAAIAVAASIATARAAELPDIIKIGVLTDLSGTYSANSGPGGVAAAKLAVEDFGGQVLGRPIEIVAGDEQNNPDLASSIARGWLDREGVVAVADGGNSATTLAALSVLKDHDRVFLITGPATTAITNQACTPISVQFTYDSYALGNTLVSPLVKQGADTWFFITADYAGGIALQNGMSQFVEKDGGKIVGSIKHPFPNADFSSYLLVARASNAKVIATANAGADTINTLKQAAEFGIGRDGKQQIAVSLFFINEVNAVGLPTAQNLLTAVSFYWDLDDATRAFTKRMREARHNDSPPEMTQAGTYSAVLHYLKAVQAAGTVSGSVVAAKMKEMPVNDFWNKDVVIRPDGRVLHEMHLMRIKTPGEAKYPYDFFKVVATLPGKDAFQPLSQNKCPLLSQR